METIQKNDVLNPAKTALVVIDLQNGIAVNRNHAPHTGEQVIANAGKLAEAFKERGSFVVLVRVSTLDGKDLLQPLTDLKPPQIPFAEGFDQIVHELARFKDAYTITKRQWGAFFGTDLDLQLRRRSIDTIVLCGISTSVGVDTTAREAYQLGYQQVFIEDAMTAGEKEEHEYVCKRIFPRIGRIRSTEEAVKMLG